VKPKVNPGQSVGPRNPNPGGISHGPVSVPHVQLSGTSPGPLPHGIANARAHGGEAHAYGLLGKAPAQVPAAKRNSVPHGYSGIVAPSYVSGRPGAIPHTTGHTVNLPGAGNAHPSAGIPSVTSIGTSSVRGGWLARLIADLFSRGR
jgi:hypothetical protein